jgi:RES domain-containing protein
MIPLDIEDTISRMRIDIGSLPRGWRRSPPPAQLAEIGDAFAAEQKSAILIVPSVLAPSEYNWLINPIHPEFRNIEIGRPESFHYDARFAD